MDLETLLWAYLDALDAFDAAADTRDTARATLNIVVANVNATAQELEDAITDYLTAADNYDLAREARDEARLALAVALFGSGPEEVMGMLANPRLVQRCRKRLGKKKPKKKKRK